MEAVFLAHIATTLALFGLIWVVQIVHYPLFARVGYRAFPGYHHDHTVLVSYLVGPLMLVEAVTAVLLVAAPPRGVPPALAVAGLVLVVVHLLSTALLQVGLHRRLAGGFRADLHDRLVATNWLRTLVWTARAGLVLWMVGRAIGD